MPKELRREVSASAGKKGKLWKQGLTTETCSSSNTATCGLSVIGVELDHSFKSPWNATNPLTLS